VKERQHNIIQAHIAMKIGVKEEVTTTTNTACCKYYVPLQRIYVLCYCISKSHMCHITSSLLQCAQNVLLRRECKRQTLTALANSRLNNLHFTR